MKRRFVSMLLVTVILCTLALSVPVASFADSNSITLGDQTAVSGSSEWTYVNTTVTGSLKTFSISTTSKLMLTSVSGTGYTFKNAVVSSSSSDATPQKNKAYISVQLTADNAAAAQTALNTIQYKAPGNITVSADSTSLASGDYYLNGHYYTLSSSGSMSWKQGMEWAFNLMTTDSTRYPGYKSYPVVVTSTEENQMLVNIWANNGSTTHRQIFLPAVPVSPVSGTSITVSGSEGHRTVTVVGEPKCSNVYTSSYGHGEVWKWMDGTPNAGQTLPQETTVTKSTAGTYWASDNPTNGGMVYFGHPNQGAVWDDLAVGGQWCSNVWTQRVTDSTFSGHMYALAEWEPASGSVTTTATKSVKQSQNAPTTVTGTKPSTPYAKDGKITGLTDQMEISNDNGATWVTVSSGATQANNLPSGTYLVRYAATDTKLASPATTVDLFVPAMAVSTDGGTTWTQYGDHEEAWKAAVAAGGSATTPVEVKLLSDWTATDGSFGTGGDATGLNDYICVPSGKYIDLDLGGKTLDGANGTGVIVNNGTLAVSNGTITGGNATQGGGVNNSGTLALNDVTVTGNTATKGGGLYTANSNVTVGGNTVITGNTGSNAYLPTGQTLNVGTAGTGMQIGVTTEQSPAGGGAVDVTGTNSSDSTGSFLSDNANYILLNGSGNVVRLHEDSWNYTADGATLTVTCAGVSVCGKTASLTISIPQTTYVYDGTQKSASLSDSAAWTALGLTVPTITYTRTGDAPEEKGVFYPEEALDSGDPSVAPSTPGEYAASITAGGATASVSFTIYKQSQSEAPTGVEGKRPSRVGAEDGKITGLTSDMEVSDDNGATWHQVPAGVTEATGLPSGIYLVRYAATDTKAASPCVSLNMLRTVATGDETPVVVLAVLLAAGVAGVLLIRRRKAQDR